MKPCQFFRQEEKRKQKAGAKKSNLLACTIHMQMPSPLHLLQAIAKAYPKAWQLADEFREMRNSDPTLTWPDRCFLPMGGWHAIINAFRPGPMITQIPDLQKIAALGAWRPTQDIYRYEPELYNHLAYTPLEGDIPVNILLRLPAWGIYIESPFLEIDREVMGFFAHLEYDAQKKESELRILFIEANGNAFGFPVLLGRWTVQESIKKIIDDIYAKYSWRHKGFVKKLTERLPAFINLVLYICSNEPDIREESGTCEWRRALPAPKKTKKGFRIFPPERPRILTVGKTVSERLYAFQKREPYSRKGPRSHIRRGHWHHYWTGKSSSRKRELHWLAPIPVALRDDPPPDE